VVTVPFAGPSHDESVTQVANFCATPHEFHE
jgi:hypothetical protein